MKESRLSKALRAAIEANGLSVVDLAQRSGVHFTTIYRFLSGGRGTPRLSLETVSRLMDALGLEMVCKENSTKS